MTEWWSTVRLCVNMFPHFPSSLKDTPTAVWACGRVAPPCGRCCSSPSAHRGCAWWRDDRGGTSSRSRPLEGKETREDKERRRSGCRSSRRDRTMICFFLENNKTALIEGLMRQIQNSRWDDFVLNWNPDSALFKLPSYCVIFSFNFWHLLFFSWLSFPSITKTRI